MEITQTHDTKILSAMVDLLVSSAQGVEDYGFTKTHNQIRYEELASALNLQGFSNRAGQPLNRNALKQVDHWVGDKTVMVGFFLFLGIICLILAPLTGITVVGAAAFFVIAYVLWKMGF